MQSIPNVLTIIDPPHDTVLPILVDSPHSGRSYPADFNYACHRQELECYEDRDVDALIRDFNRLGATVICAQAPRTYIDLNRARDDISENQIEPAWNGPFPLRPGKNCMRGTGLIWSSVGNGKHDVPIYDGWITTEQALHRIETYYDPYYTALDDRAARIRARFNRLWHLNMHSMPADTNNGRTDIVLGNLDGRSCSHSFLNFMTQTFQNQGFSVGHNVPYKGAQLTKKFGQPHRQSESLQIEISKGLYLEPNRLDRNDVKFEHLKKALDAVMKDTALYVAEKVNPYAKAALKDALSASSSSSIETSRPRLASDVTP